MIKWPDRASKVLYLTQYVPDARVEVASPRLGGIRLNLILGRTDQIYT